MIRYILLWSYIVKSWFMNIFLLFGSVMFCPNDEVDDVITLSDSTIFVWDINSASEDCARVS